MDQRGGLWSAETSVHYRSTLFRFTRKTSPEDYGAKFSPDGTVLATGAGLGEVLLWDVSTAENVARLGHPDHLEDGSGFGINGVFSPGGSLLASVGLNRIELWDVSECTGAPSPPPTQAATDFNGDGKTDFVDFFLFADAYGSTNATFDLDGNGTVDFADFFRFVDAFGS